MNHLTRVLLITIGLITSLPAAYAQERRKIRISNATLSYSALPLVAAREWKLFQEQGLDVEIILMRSAAAAAALVSGDLDYQSGIGPASISATLSGVDSRALWSSTNRITYLLMAKPDLKSVADLRRKKIGVSGLGGTSHVALNIALEKRGIGPKDYVAVSVPGGNLVQSLDSGFVDVAQPANHVFCPAARFCPGARYRFTGGDGLRRLDSHVKDDSQSSRSGEADYPGVAVRQKGDVGVAGQ